MVCVRRSACLLLLLLAAIALACNPLSSFTQAHEQAAAAAEGRHSAEPQQAIPECTADIPHTEQQQQQATTDDIEALRAEVERLRAHNAELQVALTEAQKKQQQAPPPLDLSAPVTTTTGSYPYPPGYCHHPPHFQLLPPNSTHLLSSSLSSDRSTQRHLTDAHGLTLNLEWVSRIMEPPRGHIGDVANHFGGRVEERTTLPSMAEFLREYVSYSRPFIVRNATRSWKAFQLWTDEYLQSKVGRTQVDVREDRFKDGVFHYHRQAKFRQMSFKKFVQSLKNTEETLRKEKEQEAEEAAAYFALHGKNKPSARRTVSRAGSRLYLAQAPIYWRGHPMSLWPLCDDLEGRCPQPEFTHALQTKSINLWYGQGNKTTVLHYDNNEGVMAMLSGYKRFTLYSPSQRNYLYPMATKSRSAINSRVPDAQMVGKEPLDTERFPCFAHARPIEVEVGPGDLFFLPAFWWHRVHSHGRSLGINWWFATHSLLLQQFMKTIDLNVDVQNKDGSMRPQERW